MDIRKSLEKFGAILQGKYFFAFKNGGVSDTYINIDPILTYPALVDAMGSKLVQSQQFHRHCTAVAGPAVGGIPFAYAAARALRIVDTNKSIRVAFPEKEPDGSFQFNRMAFAEAMKGKKVIVVEDILTGGQSVKATVNLVEKAGGEVIGVSAIWNRGGVTAQMLGVPVLHSLIEERVSVWEAGEHKMWGKWPLVSDIGHPENFPNYPGKRTRLQTI